MNFSYLIKFDGLQPIKIMVPHHYALIEQINRLVTAYQKPFEWVIRDY